MGRNCPAPPLQKKRCPRDHLDQIRSTSDLGAVKEEQQVAILRYLLKHGARPVVSDENQLTPLMLAGTVYLALNKLEAISCGSFSWSANLCPVAFG